MQSYRPFGSRQPDSNAEQDKKLTSTIKRKKTVSFFQNPDGSDGSPATPEKKKRETGSRKDSSDRSNSASTSPAFGRGAKYSKQPINEKLPMTQKSYPKNDLDESLFDDTTLISKSPTNFAFGRDNIRKMEQSHKAAQSANSHNSANNGKQKPASSYASSTTSVGRGAQYSSALTSPHWVRREHTLGEPNEIGFYHQLQPTLQEVAREHRRNANGGADPEDPIEARLRPKTKRY